ncbi:MAG TPA: FAD-binding oxidoreductase [Mycobacteriales bacterium]
MRVSFKTFSEAPYSVDAVDDLDKLRATIDGDLVTPGSPRYDAARRTSFARHADIRPCAVVHCASTSDVVSAVRWARERGTHLVPRGGGHCFSGRSTTDGIVLDLGRLNHVRVDTDGRARIGAGARLAPIYDGLDAHGLVLPAGCGPTVGIAGLTLGGGLGLLGRRYGLTCDALVRAEVVLADGRVVVCDAEHEPDLFWALRGAGGGQFGVVISLEFATAPGSRATRFELRWPEESAAEVAAAWQDWAPQSDRNLTVNLRIVAEAGRPLSVLAFGAALLDAAATHRLLADLLVRTGPTTAARFDPYLGWGDLKGSFAPPVEGGWGGAVTRSRSEFFAAAVPPSTVRELIDELTSAPDGRRELSFTALGGAYDDAALAATAYAHRGHRFLLEHVADDGSAWIDRSWRLAHAHGSGGVYVNFPDAALAEWATAYHGPNFPALVEVKRTYDPGEFFHFPQSVPATQPE